MIVAEIHTVLHEYQGTETQPCVQVGWILWVFYMYLTTIPSMRTGEMHLQEHK